MTDQRLPDRSSPNHHRTVCVISDTHGRLHPSALKAFEGCSLTLHAGDVGKAEVLQQLETIAPVIAVRGNVDQGAWAESLPTSKTVDIIGIRVHLLHRLEDLNLDPLAAGISAVISGHSHRAGIEQRDGVFYLNPGSVGPRRFRLPVTFMLLRISAGFLDPEIVQLE